MVWVCACSPAMYKIHSYTPLVKWLLLPSLLLPKHTWDKKSILGIMSCFGLNQKGPKNSSWFQPWFSISKWPVSEALEESATSGIITDESTVLRSMNLLTIIYLHRSLFYNPTILPLINWLLSVRVNFNLIGICIENKRSNQPSLLLDTILSLRQAQGSNVFTPPPVYLLQLRPGWCKHRVVW